MSRIAVVVMIVLGVAMTADATSPPQASLTTETPTFAEQRVGTTSAAQPIEIENTGGANLVLTSVTCAGPFAAVGFVPQTVTTGTVITINVAFAPTAPGLAMCSLSIASNDPASPLLIPLFGFGIEPVLSVSPNPIAFGPVEIGAPAGLTTTISDTGSDGLTISGLAITGPNAADFTFPSFPALPFVLGGGAGRGVNVQFVPTGRGARTAALEITSDSATGSPIDIPLTGTGIGPTIAVTPEPLALGTTKVGTPIAGTLTVTNSGDAALTVSGVTFSGADGGDFATTTALPLTVAAGSAMPLAITLTPSAIGTRTGQVAIASNDPFAATVDIDLSGSGYAPMLEASPSPVRFGDVLVGATGSASLAISNGGDSPLTISMLALGGTNASEFGGTLPTPPVVIAAGSATSIPLTFTPDSVGDFTASLTITSDDPVAMPAILALTGRGVAPMIAVSPGTIDFGSQRVAQMSTGQALTVTNTGLATLTISALAITGAQATDFALVGAPALPVSIDPAGTLTLTLAVTPAAVGARAGTLTITSDDAATPHATVGLTSVGVTALFTLSPAALDFGTIMAPGTAPAEMLTLTNTGAVPLTFGTATLGGANATAFSVSAVASTLAPGASTQLTVGFTAGAATGALSATLAIAATDPTVPTASIPLTAHAVSSVLAVAPSALAFGTIAVGATSGPRVLTFTNLGSAPITLASAALDNAMFAVAGVDTTTAIAGGATTSITVTFAPSAMGGQTGHLAITLAGQASPALVIDVTGAGGGGDAGAGGDAGTAVGNASGCGCSSDGRAPIGPTFALVALVWLVIRRRART